MSSKVANKRARDKTLNTRQLHILQQRAMGLGVQQIATKMNVHRTTVYRAMKPLDTSDWDKAQLENIISFLGLANANVAMNLEAGNLDAARMVWKALGFLTERVEFTSKTKPDEQQQKFMENIEKLLKIAGPKQALAGDVKTEAMKCAVTSVKAGTMKPGAVVHVKGLPVDVETETQSQEDKDQGEGHPPPGGSEV